MSDKAPKVFVSYSWSNPEHEVWVERFAKELVANGIDVVLDKWGLDVGNDVNAFMEQMINDPNISKVVMVFDQRYVEKSNARTGGVGTEAQIITPNLYGAVDQTKFIGVVRERDESGKAHVPTYYATRRYIDLSDPGRYSEEFKTLIRAIYNEPLYVKPAIGVRPAWLDAPASTDLATTAPLHLALDAIKTGSDRAEMLTEEFLGVVLAELEKYRIGGGGDAFDERVWASITEFVPIRDQIISIFIAAAAYRPTSQMGEVIQRFFERLIPFHHASRDMGSYHEWDFDNYKFISYELFIYCIGAFIARERFELAGQLIHAGYYVGDLLGNRREPIAEFGAFFNHLRSFEARARRLNKTELLQAVTLRERCTAAGVEFKHLMAADLVLWLAAQKMGVFWYPLTVILAANHALTFEIFARSVSKAYFDRVKVMLGVADKEELVELIRQIRAADRVPKFRWNSVEPEEATGLSALATRP